MANVPANIDPDQWAASAIPDDILNVPIANVVDAANRQPTLNWTLHIATFTRAEIATFRSFSGIQTLEDFLSFDTDSLEGVFRDIARHPHNVTPRGMTIPKIKQKNLIALRHWVFDHYRRDQLATMNARTFDDGAMVDAWNDYEHTKRLKEQTESDVAQPGPIKDLKEFAKWTKQLSNYLASIIGALLVPLTYLIRDGDEPEDMDENERLVQQARHDGPEFEEDNRRLFNIIYGLILKSNATMLEWAKGFERRSNGRQLYLALIRNFGGQAMLAARLTSADGILDSCFYNGVHRVMSWEQYTAKLTGAFQDKAAAGEPESDTKMRRKLFANIKYRTNAVFNARVAVIQQDLINYPDFSSCVSAIALVISQMQSEGTFGPQRSISVVESDGGGDESKKHVSFQHIIHGVDISDPTRTFTPSEMKKLGSKGQAIMFDARRKANSSKGHGGGGGGRHKGKHRGKDRDSHKRRKISSTQKTDDKDGDDNKDDKPENESTQNGKGFGQNGGRTAKKKGSKE